VLYYVLAGVLIVVAVLGALVVRTRRGKKPSRDFATSLWHLMGADEGRADEFNRALAFFSGVQIVSMHWARESGRLYLKTRMANGSIRIALLDNEFVDTATAPRLRVRLVAEASNPSARWLDGLSFFVPNSIREPWLGDLREDIKRMEEAGHSRQFIRGAAFGQLVLAGAHALRSVIEKILSAIQR
jgi:hypothetical protein